MSSSPAVAVCVVTYNSAQDLPGCLAAVQALEHRPLELVIVDCASRDETVAVARSCLPPSMATDLVALSENLGFAGGMNLALARTRAPFVLTLNPDARPDPLYVGCLLRWTGAGPGNDRAGSRVGAVTGRLRREDPSLLDACGMRLTLAWRHLDRGSGELDCGQLTHPARVFGATGAASLFRREALDDVAIDGEVFDPTFHSFREDAELCFRLQERGWQVIFDPDARAVHRRFNLPQRRASMPKPVNYHSLKNRYLLRSYHQTWLNFLWTLPFTLFRDVLALAYVLMLERSSLAAYGWLWRHRRRILSRRRQVQGRRTLAGRDLDRWFFHRELPL